MHWRNILSLSAIATLGLMLQSGNAIAQHLDLRRQRRGKQLVILDNEDVGRRRFHPSSLWSSHCRRKKGGGA